MDAGGQHPAIEAQLNVNFAHIYVNSELYR